MNESLYRFLAEHCRKNVVRSYLEIGTRDGGSLEVVLANARQLSDIVCCDTWGSQYGGSGRGNHKHIDQLLALYSYDGRATFLDGDSKATVPTLHNDLSACFDLVLVDGDHSYAGGMADLQNTWPLIRPGGCVALHDITHPAHPDLLDCFAAFVAERGDEVASWREILEPYGVGVAVKR